MDDLKKCGPNDFIAGDVGDNFDYWNNIQIYYNNEAKVYYLDQVFYPKDLIELEDQIERLLMNLKDYNKGVKG